MLHIGLVSVSFRKNSPEEILSACAAIGIDAIEWGSDIHAPASDTERLKRLAALGAEKGIRCCSYGTYFRAGINTPREILPYIHAAKILGTRILRIWCGNKGSDDYTEAETAALFADCKELARIAEEADVILCTEFHNNTYTDTAESVKALANALKSSHFKTYWQPNQFRTTEENLASAEAVADMTEQLHVFQWKGRDKFSLRDGVEEWKAYFSCFAGEHAALLEFMPDDDIQTLPSEYKILQQIIGEIQ